MKKFVKIAWRNIWRNRRRSLITMTAIMFAILITGVTRSLQYGTYDTLESYAVRLMTGEMQLQKKGFFEHQTLAYAFPENLYPWDRLMDEYEFVEAYARRITSYGLVGSATTSAGAMIIGVEPGREKQVTYFMTQLAAGETLDDGDDRRVLLGKGLADNLNVTPGDTVVVLTQGFRNQLGADMYVVKGLIRSGNQELDRALMVMPLHNAQDLFSLYGRITQIVLATRDFRRTEDYASRMHIAMDGEELRVLPWQTLMPELLQLIALDNISGAIFLLFLLLIVGFEIMNTTLMAIMERIKEFGILQSLGVKPRQISLMLLLETGMKISLAVSTGLLLTFLFIQLIKDYPIPLSSELKKAMEAWGFYTDFYFTDRVRVFIEPLVAISVIAVLSVIYPIWTASRLRPVDALRKGQL